MPPRVHGSRSATFAASGLVPSRHDSWSDQSSRKRYVVSTRLQLARSLARRIRPLRHGPWSDHVRPEPPRIASQATTAAEGRNPRPPGEGRSIGEADDSLIEEMRTQM